MFSTLPGLRLSILSSFIMLCLISKAAYSIEFNTDILDDDLKDNIDLSRFSQAGYIMPGKYLLRIAVNGVGYNEVEIEYLANENKSDEDAVVACIAPEVVSVFGLKESILGKLKYWHNNQCLDVSTIEGMKVRGDLSTSTLNVSIPQALLEYTDANWLPPSAWDTGLTGFIFDYNVNSSFTNSDSDSAATNVSGNGTVGFNYSAWRFRGDYQGSYRNTSTGSAQNLDWSRIYAYRPLPSLTSRLEFGETYLESDMFDSWRFTGASLTSDENMLPPKLRGYAPEIKGIAKTNAKVTVSQQGRILSQITVAAGPFSINNLSNNTKGRVDVKVEEEDGSVQTYSVDTATIPYLTRPGQVRYKLALGKPSDYDHHVYGPMFTTGELSWGLTNSWSLYGGGITSDDYNAVSIGLGRDLYLLGALSADVTQSWAKLDKNSLQGKSWRLSYSKHFEDLDSDITFAGYRFSDEDYISMGQFLDYKKGNSSVYKGKELYTISTSKSFVDEKMSLYFSWNHQTYWNRDDTNYYNLSLNKYVDIGQFRNISLGASVSRSQYNNDWEDTFFFTVGMPLSSGNVSYSGNFSKGNNNNNIGYYGRLSNRDSYSIRAGLQNDDGTRSQFSGVYNYKGNYADLSVNGSHVQNKYSSIGLSARGGVTVATKGAAIHPGGGYGNTRILVDSDGVEDVPIGDRIRTNKYGYGVLTDVNSYFKSTTRIDVNKLDDNVEPGGSPVKEIALTEGAIGYHVFEILKGAKVMSVIRLPNGKYPPFGAQILNGKKRELGIVGDGGNSWITGVNSNETATVSWEGQQCTIRFPQEINTEKNLLLPCI